MKTRLDQIEEAIIYLAEMMEDPTHDMYMIKDKVLDILRLEEIKNSD